MREAYLRVRVCEAERDAEARGAISFLAGTEAEVRERLDETKRERGVHVQDHVAEALRRRCGGSNQGVQRLFGDAQLASSGRELPVGFRDAPYLPDAPQRGHLKRPNLRSVEVSGALYSLVLDLVERTTRERAWVHRRQHHPRRHRVHVQQHPRRPVGLDLSYPRSGHRRRKADVELDAQRLRYLFVEELARAPMPSVDAADEFAFIPAEADAVVAVPLPGLPGGLLPGDRRGKRVKVGDRL